MAMTTLQPGLEDVEDVVAPRHVHGVLQGEDGHDLQKSQDWDGIADSVRELRPPIPRPAPAHRKYLRRLRRPASLFLLSAPSL